jgi:hypothetical protein
MGQNSKLPLRLNRSAHFAAVKDRVEASIPSIIDTLHMVLNKDQRLGAKLLYNQNGLDDVVRRYLAAAIDLRGQWEQRKYNNLYEQASAFIGFIRNLFPDDNSRMVTALNAIYAGVRGVENICISAIKYAYEQAILVLQDAGSKARPTLVKIGAVAIIAVALAVISNSMPIIKSASELNWILENLPQIEKISRILK